MKIHAWGGILLVFAFIATACAPQPGKVEPPPMPTATAINLPEASPVQTEVDLMSIVIDDLAARTGLKADEIELLSFEKHDWPDACLGLPEPGELCAQTLTPGYRVLLAASGRRYPLRVDETGKTIRPEPEVKAQSPAATAAQRDLAKRLRVDPQAIQVIDEQAMQWPDSCLGIQAPDRLCAQVITPGFQITLVYQGSEYVYHTDTGGEVALLAKAPESSMGAPFLIFAGVGSPQRELHVSDRGAWMNAPGEVQILAPFAAEERAGELQHFLEAYRAFRAEFDFGWVDFRGQGSREATAAEQRAVAEWARLVDSESQSAPDRAEQALALSWSREGGIAGFCDRLSIFRYGKAVAENCRDAKTPVRAFWLDSTMLKTLFESLDRFSPAKVSSGDSAIADAMTLRLDFKGAGNEPLPAAAQDEVMRFAAEVLAFGSKP